MTIVQTQCCQFLKFLIKKELMFFTNGCSCSLPRRVGRSYLQIGKGYVQWEKIKTKKVTMYRLKK